MADKVKRAVKTAAKKTSTSGVSASSSSNSGGSSYSGTNYHQDAIDAAARGDWGAVNTALNNRQSKIDAQGGNDRGVSNAQILADLQSKYGGSSGGNKSVENANTSSFNGVSYTKQQGTGVYGVPTVNSEQKNYNQGGVTYRVGADMSRRPDLAGQVAISNGYTVFYDENGYATKAIKGVADYTPNKDLNAANGTYNQNGAWTDNQMLTKSQLDAIQSYRDAAAAGTMTWADANAKANAIRAGYGYSIDNKGNVTNSGALSAVNDRRKQYGLPVNQEDGATAYYRYLMQTDTSPVAQAMGKVQTYQQFATENGYDANVPTAPQNADYSVPAGINGVVQTIPLPGNSVIGGSGSAGGGVGGGSGSGNYAPGTSDVYTPGNMGNYLNQWYQNAQQQQQNTIDFGTNQAILELLRNKQDAEAQYQEQRNQIAIDEAKAKDNQALYAEARGDKGGIGAAQYDAIMNTAAQNRLAVNSAQTKLATDTSRQIADLRAQGEYEKADALLTLSQQYLSQLMSLEQWAAEYNLSVAQFNASLQQWQAEYDLKVADLLGSYNGQQTLSAKQFAFNQQQYQDSLKADQEKKLASAGEILLAAGIMPSASQLAAMGMTETEAQSYITAKKVEAAAKAKGSGSGSTGSGGGTKKMTKTTAEDMAEAGQFTDAVVNWFKTNGYTDKYLKETYGWNGVTLEEQRQQNIDTANAGAIKNDFDQMMRAITAQLASGKESSIEVARQNAEKMWPGLNDSTRQSILNLFAHYGYPLKVETD